MPCPPDVPRRPGAPSWQAPAGGQCRGQPVHQIVRCVCTRTYIHTYKQWTRGQGEDTDSIYNTGVSMLVYFSISLSIHTDVHATTRLYYMYVTAFCCLRTMYMCTWVWYTLILYVHTHVSVNFMHVHYYSVIEISNKDS